MKKLIHTTNNAYDMMLLVENDEVIGAWDYDKAAFDAATPESVQDWEATCPDETKIEDYGQIVETK